MIIHAAAIEYKNFLLTSFLLNLLSSSAKASSAVSFNLWPGLIFCLFGFSKNSRKNPIPNIEPIAICVELTGSPNVVAIKTVIADDIATQYALGAFNLVIFWPTVFINFGPNKRSPKEIPIAPMNITQNGMLTLELEKIIPDAQKPRMIDIKSPKVLGSK